MKLWHLKDRTKPSFPDVWVNPAHVVKIETDRTPEGNTASRVFLVSGPAIPVDELPSKLEAQFAML